MLDTTRGVPRARAWPRKRPTIKSAFQRRMMTWFGDAMSRIKYAESRAVDGAIKASRGTGFYPRDLLMAAYSGTIIGPIETPEGTVIVKKRGLQEVAFQGTLLNLTPNYAKAASTQIINWTEIPVIDTCGCYNPANVTRLTIPAGVTIANIRAALRTDTDNTLRIYLEIRRNGADRIAWQDISQTQQGSNEVETGPLPVNEGDYFEVRSYFSEARTLQNPIGNCFSIEILAASF